MEMGGGNQLTFDAILKPNFLYFVITLAVIAYLYQTKTVLSREQSVKSKSGNLFDQQLYLEVGFMILIGLSIYILNNGENTTFIWLYMLIPIIYLVLKSLMVFNKVTDFIKEAPNAVDVDSDLADLISKQANANTNTQIPTVNQNSNTSEITNALNNALNSNSLKNNGAYINATGFGNNVQQAPQAPQVPQFQNPMNSPPDGFSLF